MLCEKPRPPTAAALASDTLVEAGAEKGAAETAVCAALAPAGPLMCVCVHAEAAVCAGLTP